jgi:hypothetical protein
MQTEPQLTKGFVIAVSAVAGALLTFGWLTLWAEGRRLRAEVRRDAMAAIRRLRR